MICNTLNKDTFLIYKWYKKLLGRFLNLVPIETTMIVLFTILSQLLILISSLLPLKIIMILGSERIPKFFPVEIQAMSINRVVIFLAIASVCIYLLYLLSEKIVSIFSEHGTKKVLMNNNKIILFEHQDEILKKSYLNLTKSFSNFIFFMISFILLLMVYPVLSIFMIILIGFVYILTCKFSNSLLEVIKEISFLIVFIFIVWSYLENFYAPKIILSIISILLVRQMIVKVYQAIKQIIGLYKQKVKINTLVFYNHIETSHSNTQDDFLYLAKNIIKDKLLKVFLDENVIVDKMEIYYANMKDILYYKINVKNQNSFLIKIYNKNKAFISTAENILLEETVNMNGLYLPYIGSFVIDGYQCNIFSYKNVKKLNSKEFMFSKILIRIKLMQIQLPNSFVSKYLRAHLVLYKRLNKSIFDKLYFFSNDQTKLVDDFKNIFHSIIIIMEKMPLQLINLKITPYSLVECHENLILLHFGEYKIEPLGFDYFTDLKSLNLLEENLMTIKHHRKDIKKLDIKHIMLVSLMAQFEKAYNNENFTLVFELIPKILELFTKLKKVS